METKHKVAIILAIIGLLGGGGSLLYVDQSTNISTTIGDITTTIVNEAMDNEELKKIGTDIALDILCERAPDDILCD